MPTSPPSRRQRWLWFVGLWAASVLTVGAIAAVIRFALGGAS